MKNGDGKSSAQKKKTTMVKGQLSLKSFFCHDATDDVNDVNDDEETQRRKRSVDFEEEGVKEEKTETKKTSRDDDCAAQPETNKRAKVGFEEEDKEEEDEKEKDNEKFTIPERDSGLRERFNA